MNDIILDYPKLSRADLSTLAAIIELGAKAERKDLAELASITQKRISECAGRLQAAGLLQNNRYYDRKSGKTRSTRLVTLPPTRSNRIVTLPKTKNGLAAPHGAMLPNGDTSCMYDDDVKKEIEKELAFFDAPGLKKLLQTPHLSPELAQAWAQHKIWRDLNGWGNVKNPEGYIFSQLKKGAWPTVQQELPESAIDLTEQYEPPPGLENARYIQHPDGIRVWK